MIHKPPGDASFSALFNKCKHAAKQRKLEFSLTRAEHRAPAIKDCHYCGAEPVAHNSYLKNQGKDQVRPNRYSEVTITRNWIKANGIDRVDNSQGYVPNNCVSCCSECNYLKCDIGYDHFISLIARIHNHIQGKAS